MIRIKKFDFNIFSENTYLVWTEESRECIIVDPGCSNSYEENVINTFISNEKLQVKYLLNTHCHIDHIIGNAFIKSIYNPEFLAPEEDVFLLDLLPDQSMKFGFEPKTSPKPDKYLKEGIALSLSASTINPLFTPGHSPGGYCLYFPVEKFCITGDVLFKESIGRTDLWGGNYDELIDSIEKKLFLLPDSVIIYPGHGDSSSIGYEKTHNPFLV
jgi:hydroxyacylglutathione hydrolase